MIGKHTNEGKPDTIRHNRRYRRIRRITSSATDAIEESGGKNATERNDEGLLKKEQARRYIGER